MIKVTLCYPHSAHDIWKVSCFLDDGATIRDLLLEACFSESFPDVDLTELGMSVYGQKVGIDEKLSDGDRVEICRPLTFDPMESRRRRAEMRKEGILKRNHLKRRTPQVEVH